MKRTARFFLSLVWPWLTSFFYFMGVAYLFHHAEDPSITMKDAIGMALMLSILGIISSLILRLVPVGQVGIVVFGSLVMGLMILFVTGTRRQIRAFPVSLSSGPYSVSFWDSWKGNAAAAHVPPNLTTPTGATERSPQSGNKIPPGCSPQSGNKIPPALR